MTQTFKVGDVVRATRRAACGDYEEGDLALVLEVEWGSGDEALLVRFLVERSDHPVWPVREYEVELVEDV